VQGVDAVHLLPPSGPVAANIIQKVSSRINTSPHRHQYCYIHT
jgi:hypothetical protein